MHFPFSLIFYNALLWFGLKPNSMVQFIFFFVNKLNNYSLNQFIMKCTAARRQIIRLILWLHVRYCWLSGWAGEINIWLELVANWLNPARYMWHDQKPKMLLSSLTSLDQSAFYCISSDFCPFYFFLWLASCRTFSGPAHTTYCSCTGICVQ